jgi:hypothetical protein
MPRKSPPIPPEQRSFAGGGDAVARMNSARPDRRDLATEVQSPDPGDADVNLETQGRFGNLRQNLQPRARTQNR